MADKKIEKALYGPSLTEVALGAVLGLFAGVLVASVYLVFKPVEAIKAPPKEPSVSMVYYQAGSDSGAKSRGWQAKQQKFAAGQPIVVVEDELNAWAASLKKPSAPKKEGEEAPAEGILIPDVPNFRFVEGKVQIGLQCTLNWYGLAHTVTVQAVGNFRKSGSEFVFVPEKVYLGSCPVHLIPGASGLLVSQLITRSKLPDDIRAAWAQLGTVELEGDTLTLAGQ